VEQRVRPRANFQIGSKTCSSRGIRAAHCLRPRLFRAYGTAAGARVEEAEASLSLVSLGFCNCASGCGMAGNTNRIADDHLSRREDVRGALARASGYRTQPRITAEENTHERASEGRRRGVGGKERERERRWRQTVKSPRT